MPQGPEFDDYRVSIFVQVIDDSDAIASFNITTPVIVRPTNDSVGDLTASILSGDPDSGILKEIDSGDLQNMARNIISLTSIINTQSLNETDLETKMAVKEKLVNVTIGQNITDVSSIKVLASVLSILTQNTDEISENTTVLSFFFNSNSTRIALKAIITSRA